MKLKKIIPLMLFASVSCGNNFKKINERRSAIGDLEINQYQISLISNIHDHVDVTKDGKTEHIIKVNTGDIDTIFLVQDTLVIKTVRHPVIYEKKNTIFNYLIKIDSVPASGKSER
jgi:hypothetical protein